MNKESTEFDHILSICLDQLVDGNWTIEECLANFPEHGESLEELLTLAQYLRQAQAIRPEPDFYRLSRQRLRTRLRPRNPSLWQRFQWWLRDHSSPSRPRRRRGYSDPWRLALATVVLVLLFLGGGVGVLYAASDAALPGDALYPLDLRFEEMQLRLADDPDTSDSLRLAFSEERLSEAETLAARGDSEQVQVALVAYAVQVEDLAQNLTIGASDAQELSRNTTVGTQLNTHEERLDTLYLELGPSVDSSALDSDGYCAPEGEAPPHPVALTLAQQYQLAYEDVIEWSCAGHGFGEITLALTTASANQLSAEDVLAMKDEIGGWGQVWHALADGIPPGLQRDGDDRELPVTPTPPDEIGPPDDVGPPEDAGPPDDVGPPDDAGPPDGTGRPDNTGPPDGAGPPDNVGPPDNSNAPDDTGPPDDAGPPENPGPPGDSGQSEDVGQPDDAGEGNSQSGGRPESTDRDGSARTNDNTDQHTAQKTLSQTL